MRLYHNRCFASGFIYSAVIVRIGCRATCIIGGLLMSFGCLLSSFAPNLYTLYFTYGILMGKPRDFPVQRHVRTNSTCICSHPPYPYVNGYHHHRDNHNAIMLLHRHVPACRCGFGYDAAIEYRHSTSMVWQTTRQSNRYRHIRVLYGYSDFRHPASVPHQIGKTSFVRTSMLFMCSLITDISEIECILEVNHFDSHAVHAFFCFYR